MRSTIIAAAAAVVSLLAVERVASAQVSYGPGFSVTWVNQGNAWAARQLAVCYYNSQYNSGVYALNYNGGLFYSSQGGAAGTWAFQMYMPEQGYLSDSSIACPNGGFAYFDALTQWISRIGSNNQLYHVAYLGEAETIGTSENYALFALNGGGEAGEIYATSYSNFSPWTQEGFFSGGARVGGWVGQWMREYVSDFDGNLFYSDNGGWQWSQFPLGCGSGCPDAQYDFGVTMGTESGHLLYVLDPNKNVWQGQVRETDCTDGVDNDGNGYIDSADPACRAVCNAQEWTVCGPNLPNVICCSGLCWNGVCGTWQNEGPP